jgi:hypothetical protein
MPTINCTEFSRQLAELVERRASIDVAQLREHAGACPQCRELWLDSLIVERAVVAWKKPAPSADLSARILAQVAAGVAPIEDGAPLGAETAPAREIARPERGAGRRILGRQILGRQFIGTAGLSLAALALGLVAMLLIRRPLPPAAPTQPVAGQNSVVDTTNVASTSPAKRVAAQVDARSPASAGAPVELMVADAGSAYLHLAGDAAKAVTAATVLVPSADPVADAPAAPPSDDHWVDGVREEIAPVTHQLSHAFEFLIQAVPEKRTPAT